ncbi:hypothetical protein GQ42DRAFT_165188 [Ramicandelaber brevisporus]|nr:hypothetical protein GQ42DRAFT_165188 [Ramicandelaber brevisporus]
MTDTTTVSVETVEVPLLPADNKAFYRDLDVPQHASQDEVLEAAAHAFYRLCGYDPSLTIAEPSDKINKKDVLNKSTTILAAFSTLYDAKSRAAYDKFGDDMFSLLRINSHTAKGHPSNSFKGSWKQFGLFILVVLLLGVVIVGPMIYFSSPDRIALHVAIAFAVLLFGPAIFGTVMQLVWYMHLSSTGEIKRADPQLVSAIDPSRELLVRLYGSRLVFNQLALLAMVSFCCLVYIIVIAVVFSYADHIPRGKVYLYIPLIVPGIVGFGASISKFGHNGGYSVPHLGIFFHTVASRVSIDLPNLSTESREKLFELIDSVVLTARFNALGFTSLFIAIVVSYTVMALTSNAVEWHWVYFGAYLGFLVFVSVIMHIFKRHWSYAGYAQHSAA